MFIYMVSVNPTMWDNPRGLVFVSRSQPCMAPQDLGGLLPLYAISGISPVAFGGPQGPKKNPKGDGKTSLNGF